MAKIQMRKKDIAAIRRHVVAVGYGDLQRTLRKKTPIGYFANVYGWRCDVYIISDDVAICTGYDPIGVDLPHELYADDMHIDSPEAAETKLAAIIKWARKNA